MKQLIFILLSFGCGAFAQDPAAFTIGEEVLGDAHVYDLYQDVNQNYWIATNSGVFKYDGYNFKQMQCEDMLSHSSFYLCGDNHGRVYFTNLNGQIFQINNDSCRLYHQIPDSLLSHNILLGVDHDGTPTYATRGVFRIKENGVLETLVSYSEEHAFFGDFRKNSKQEMMLYAPKHQEIFFLKNGAIRKEHYKGPNQLSFMMLKGMPISYDGHSQLHVYSNNKWQKYGQLKDEFRRVYSDNENIWLVNPTGGASIYGSNQNIFIKTIISALLRDQEGNILLGTFGEGIKVIPNMRSVEYQFDSDKPTSITSSFGYAYVGLQSGGVAKIQPLKQLEMIRLKGDKMVEQLAVLPNRNQLIVDDKNAVLLGINSEEKIREIGAIKDIFVVDENTLLLASNLGAFQLTINENSFQQELIFGESKRTNCIAFDKKSGTYYAGESTGLLIGKSNAFSTYQLNGRSVIARDISVWDDKTYVCTQNLGVLIFNGEKLIDHWNTESGLPSNLCKQIEHTNKHIFLNTNSGVFLLDKNGKAQKKIGASDGLFENSISGISIVRSSNQREMLALNTRDKTLFLEVSTLLTPTKIPALKAHIYSEKKSIEEDEKLKSSENRIKIIFEAKTLKYQKDISYEFMLSGIDQTWQENTFTDNIVEYKSVPPGDYTFKYRIKVMNESGPENVFQFSIAHPFWMKWWFIILCAVVLALIAYLIYKKQLHIQRKKADFQKELIASKLTAVQSQMNPHFIFNSLNSIQDLVLKQEGNKAYDYISKFAFLVRQVLHYSDADWIDLASEIKVLNVYLELEKLRFNEDFSFSLSCDADYNIEIPPMIVQPFVENALKHGLLHKKGEKELEINFAYSNGALICEIVDNGVGRRKSSEINQRKAKLHESFSVKSIRSRFDILRSKYGGELGVEFEDLYENDRASGTKVTLKLPVRDE